QAECRNPGDLTHDIHDLVTQVLHRDEPFIDQAEDEFSLTAPASRIAVFVILFAIKQALLLQILSDRFPNLCGILACEPVKPFYVDAELVDGCYDCEIELFREAKVLTATTGSDVNDACTLARADLFPGYD